MLTGSGVPSEGDLLSLLERRYPAPSWAFLTQVADRTGQCERWADAVAMSCWPSLGLEIHGFEIKRSRADFLRELKDGSKSHAVFRYCDRWWLVAPEGVVRKPELPPTWGLLVHRRGALRCERQAPALSPEPLDRPFLASVLRRAMRTVTAQARLAAEIERARREGREEGLREAAFRCETAKAEAERLREAIASFERETGIEFPRVSAYWSNAEEAARLGRAVRSALSAEWNRGLELLGKLRETARAIVDMADKALAESAPAGGNGR